ncbi:helix-turn-helix domain-containing protein [Bacteroides sp. UBA939]|uniref:helix-turn-helix domain-containing protein n=1 Tax=Bacteroides sp. UBA939 TaxID=1946092 RepID=UPI0025C58E5B|nr:helix-turn-helix domain-containing protein [Bacteroides sp. UBA939]
MANESNAATPLTMAVVPQSFLDGLIGEVREVKNLLRKKSEEEVNNQWVESAQARKMLGVSAKTWQTYRDERRIPFSQFGRKIYVKRADLEKFMADHYISADK